jgi:hypothetical protein
VHPAEKATINAFIVPGRREQYLSRLDFSAKTRLAFINRR